MHIDFRIDQVSLGLIIVLSNLLSFAAHAQDPVDRGIIFMSANYGYINYDSDRGFDDRDFGGVALGLYFNRQWSASLFYSRSHPDNQSADNNRFENYFVQGKYYWRGDSYLRTYWVFGLGEMLQGEGRVASDTTVHTGVGLHWTISAKWAAQLDYRYYYAFGDELQEQSLMAGIVYRFADGER